MQKVCREGLGVEFRAGDGRNDAFAELPSCTGSAQGQLDQNRETSRKPAKNNAKRPIFGIV